MSRLGWLELDLVVVKLGFSRRDHLARLVARLISRGIINTKEFSPERGETSAVGGRTKKLLFLAPSAVVAVSAHATTPESAEFRREALATLATLPSNALPSAPTADITVLQQAVFKLEQRVDALTLNQCAVVERVEKIEARIPEQLRLPMAFEVDNVALHAAFVAAFEKLQAACGTRRGLTSTEVFEQICSGNEAALELREIVKALNGGRMPGSSNPLGKILQRVADSNGALEGQWGHNHARRWVVTANGVH